MILDPRWLVFTAEGNKNPRFARIVKVPSRETLARGLYSSKGEVKKSEFLSGGHYQTPDVCVRRSFPPVILYKTNPFLISQWFQL